MELVNGVLGLGACANNITAMSEKVDLVANKIASLSANWSVTSSGVYNISGYATILTNTNGAQICLAIGTAIARIHVNNLYASAAYAAYEIAMAFKPQSASGNFPTPINGTNNPENNTTFCSGCGSYNFMKTRLYDDSSYFHSAECNLRVLVDDASDSGTVILIGSCADQYDRYLYVFADDGADSVNFSSMYGTDTEKSFMFHTRLPYGYSATVRNLKDTTGGTSSTSLKLAFINTGGTVVEEAQLDHLFDCMDYYIKDTDNLGTVPKTAYKMYKDTGGTSEGNKGIIDTNLMCQSFSGMRDGYFDADNNLFNVAMGIMLACPEGVQYV